MRRYVTSPLWAGLIVVVSAIGVYALTYSIGPRWLGVLASAPGLPGLWATLFLGLGSGAHGVPIDTDIAPYVLTFLLWWGIIHQGREWLRRRGTRARHTS